MSYKQKTTNFQLPQWELSEPPQMDDFNTAFANIDQKAVPKTRTINGKPLSTNITLTAANVNALAKTDAEPWTTSKTTSRDPWILTYRKIGYKLMQFQLQAVFRGSQLEHNTDEVVGYTPIFVKEAFYFPVWMTVAGGVAGIGVGMVNEKQEIRLSTPAFGSDVQYVGFGIASVIDDLDDVDLDEVGG